MNRKSIIFLVFASLVQCSFVSSLSVDFGLSDASVASLITLIKYQDLATEAGIDGFDKIFIKIEKEASKLIHGLEDRTVDDDSGTSEPVLGERLIDATTYSLDGFIIIIGEPCSAIEERSNKSTTRFANVTTAMEAAFELSITGDFTTNRAQLETYQTTVLGYFKDSVQTAYDALSTCLASSDAGVEAEIIFAREQSDIGLRYAVDSIFNALKFLSVAISAGEAVATLMAAIGECRSETQNIIRYDIQNKFSALKTILVATELGLTGSMLAVSYNQYAWTLSSFDYKAAIDAIFDIILANFQKVELGFGVGGKANLSRADAAGSIAMNKMNAAHEIFLGSVLALHDNAITAVEVAKEAFATATRDIIVNFVLSIDAAQAASQNYSESVGEIEYIREMGPSFMSQYVALYFGLIRNGETYDDEVEAELVTLTNAADDAFGNFMNSTFDAISYLAEVVHSNDASEAYRTAILTAKDSTITSCGILAEQISAAGILVLGAKNSN